MTPMKVTAVSKTPVIMLKMKYENFCLCYVQTLKLGTKRHCTLHQKEMCLLNSVSSSLSPGVVELHEPSISHTPLRTSLLVYTTSNNTCLSPIIVISVVFSEVVNLNYYGWHTFNCCYNMYNVIVPCLVFYMCCSTFREVMNNLYRSGRSL